VTDVVAGTAPGAARSPSGEPAVSELAVTAIKGFRLHHPTSVRLTGSGAVGNRDFLVVDGEDRLLSVTRSGAFLPYWSRFDPATGVLAVGRGSAPHLAERVELREPVRAHLFGDRYVDAAHVVGPWDAFLSALVDTPVRLLKVLEPSGGYDVHPVTLMSEASVAVLGDEGDGSPLDRRRFRLLLTCDGLGPFEEDAWTGRELAVGSAVLRVGGPVPRCAAVQRHPDHPDRPVDALRRIARLRGPQPSESGRTLNLGVYASVVRPGTVTVGDRLLPDPSGGPAQPE
jgi:MOSC domain-containing protein